jgi:hypothetical protein
MTIDKQIEPETISQEDIPELIEMVLPIIKKEIIRLQHEAVLTKEDRTFLMQSIKSLQDTYGCYRALKSDIQKQVRVNNPNSLIADLNKWKHMTPNIKSEKQ